MIQVDCSKLNSRLMEQAWAKRCSPVLRYLRLHFEGNEGSQGARGGAGAGEDAGAGAGAVASGAPLMSPGGDVIDLDATDFVDFVDAAKALVHEAEMAEHLNVDARLLHVS